MCNYVNNLLLRIAIADFECCICFRKKPMKSGGYETLSKIEAEPTAKTLKSSALKKQNNTHVLACVWSRLEKYSGTKSCIIPRATQISLVPMTIVLIIVKKV